jgi:hypothetical protein
VIRIADDLITLGLFISCDFRIFILSGVLGINFNDFNAVTRENFTCLYPVEQSPLCYNEHNYIFVVLSNGDSNFGSFWVQILSHWREI